MEIVSTVVAGLEFVEFTLTYVSKKIISRVIFTFTECCTVFQLCFSSIFFSTMLVEYHYRCRMWDTLNLPVHCLYYALKRQMWHLLPVPTLFALSQRTRHPFLSRWFRYLYYLIVVHYPLVFTYIYTANTRLVAVCPVYVDINHFAPFIRLTRTLTSVQYM